MAKKENFSCAYTFFLLPLQSKGEIRLNFRSQLRVVDEICESVNCKLYCNALRCPTYLI